MAGLLIIDDEQAIHRFLRVALRDMPVVIASSLSSGDGIDRFRTDRPDVVILDVNMPEVGGLETFRQLRAIDPKVPVIFATGGGTTGTAIEAIALGAFEYLLKPLAPHHVQEVVARALTASRLMRELPVISEEDPKSDGSDVLIGRCPAMQSVFKAIGRVASQDIAVLVVGESGTGKELVARAVYQFSRRARCPFIRVDCAGISDADLQNELFGHEPCGGADQRRVGKVEQGSGGTLFLDEIADMSLANQAKLLHLLQQREFQRSDGTGPIAADVRIIAATSRDLAPAVASGAFRRDLYYQLQVAPIKLPALRERFDDLPLLVSHFLHGFALELNKTVHAVAPEAMAILKNYSWPGNVGELQSVLKNAVLQANGPIVAPECLPEEFQRVGAANTAEPSAPEDVDQFIDRALAHGSAQLFADWMRAKERELLVHILRRTKKNISAAAKILGISRATIRAKITDVPIATDQLARGAPPGNSSTNDVETPAKTGRKPRSAQ